MSIKQSVCIPILPQDAMSQEALIEIIADIGFDAIEIWMRGHDFDSLCQIAGRYGVPVVSMIGHQSLPDGLNNPANHDRIVAELKQSIDIAAVKGVWISP